MTRSKTPRPVFRYLSGDPSLDFVNTVDWTPKGLTNELLPNYDELTRWAVGAGILNVGDARRLRRAAQVRPDAAAAVCIHAHKVRGLLQRLFRSIVEGKNDAAIWEEF